MPVAVQRPRQSVTAPPRFRAGDKVRVKNTHTVAVILRLWPKAVPAKATLGWAEGRLDVQAWWPLLGLVPVA